MSNRWWSLVDLSFEEIESEISFALLLDRLLEKLSEEISIQLESPIIDSIHLPENCQTCINSGFVPQVEITQLEPEIVELGNSHQCLSFGDIFSAVGDFKNASNCYYNAFIVNCMLEYPTSNPMIRLATQLNSTGHYIKAAELFLTAYTIQTEEREPKFFSRYFEDESTEIDNLELTKFSLIPEDPPKLFAEAFAFNQEGNKALLENDFEKAINLFYNAAVNHIPDSQFSLGRMYHRGIGLNRSNHRRGDFWLRRSILLGNKQAIVDLGNSHRFGVSGIIDNETAEKLYKISSNYDAFIQLGNMFKYGFGSIMDLETAFQWHLVAAQSGGNSGWIHVADYFRKVKDKPEIAEMFEKKGCAQLTMINEYDDGSANCSLGFCSFYGLAGEKKLTEAANYYLSAARRGHATAQENLAKSYFSGEGIDKNMDTAVYWYRRAGDQGRSASLFNLACSYANGEGVERNLNEAARLYKLAAELGHSDAENNYANCLSRGEGVERNLSEAVKFYHRSSLKGNDIAQYNLGNCYYNGTGVEQDFTEACHWFKMSADQGDTDAQYIFAYCLENGKGAEKNLSEAFKLYKNASEKQHVYAQNQLGEFYYYGKSVPVNHSMAFNWFEKSASQHCTEAVNHVANCYFYGHGTKRDLKLAVTYYNRAIHFTPESYNNFGLLAFFGRGGVRVDVDTAVNHLLESSNGSYADGHVNLAECWLSGIGVEEIRTSESERLFKLAADTGHAEGYYGLWRTNKKSNNISDNDGMDLLKKATDLGSYRAMIVLGNLEDEKSSLENNSHSLDAANWYKNAANTMMKKGF
ncbi:hypothetical protein HK096_005763, partial [Nowakowskiella sp. JEL0078]